MGCKRYLKNIPEVFGKIFDALLALFKKPANDPSKIASIKEFHVTSVEIPEEFLPFIAYELGCLYDWRYWGGLDRERIVKFRMLRELEGTTPGLVEAVKGMDTLINPESVVFTRTGGCTGTLNAVIYNEKEWQKTDWQYLHYLISDYKRASLWLATLLERILERDLYAGAGVINSANVTMPVQPVITGGEPLYAGCGIIECRETVFPVQVIN